MVCLSLSTHSRPEPIRLVPFKESFGCYISPESHISTNVPPSQCTFPQYYLTGGTSDRDRNLSPPLQAWSAQPCLFSVVNAVIFTTTLLTYILSPLILYLSSPAPCTESSFSLSTSSTPAVSLSTFSRAYSLRIEILKSVFQTEWQLWTKEISFL